MMHRLKHSYEAEINLLPNDRLAAEKNTFALIIKSKCNTEQTPFSCYHQTLIRDLDTLRALDAGLDAEKNTERLQLICNLEHILRIHNLVIADSQKIEQEQAKIEKRKEESEKRKIEKELLELEKYRLKIASIHETKHINAQIKNELHHLHEQLEIIKNKFLTIEKNQSARTEYSASNHTELKTKMATLHDELKKLITRSETASANSVKILEEIKKSLEDLVIISSVKPPPPFNPAVMQPEPIHQSPPAPRFNSSGMQAIPMPIIATVPPL